MFLIGFAVIKLLYIRSLFIANSPLLKINSFEGFGAIFLTKLVVLNFKTKLRKPIEDKNIFFKIKKKLNRTLTNVHERFTNVHEKFTNFHECPRTSRKFAENLSRTPTVGECHRRSANFRILKFRMARIVNQKMKFKKSLKIKILKNIRSLIRIRVLS